MRENEGEDKRKKQSFFKEKNRRSKAEHEIEENQQFDDADEYIIQWRASIPVEGGNAKDVGNMGYSKNATINPCVQHQGEGSSQNYAPTINQLTKVIEKLATNVPTKRISNEPGRPGEWLLFLSEFLR